MAGPAGRIRQGASKSPRGAVSWGRRTCNEEADLEAADPRTHADIMHLKHLALPIADEQRTRDFYETYFGFDPATATRAEDGVVIIRNNDGFDLALLVQAPCGEVAGRDR